MNFESFGFEQPKMPPPEVVNSALENHEGIDELKLEDVVAGEKVVIETQSGGKYLVEHLKETPGKFVVYRQRGESSEAGVIRNVDAIFKRGESLNLAIETNVQTREGTIIRSSPVKSIERL